MKNPYLETNFNSADPQFVSVIDELPFWSAPFGIELLKIIHPKKNITVLDIGSGLGFPLLEVAMRLGNTCRVFGIDPWKAACDRINEKINIYGIKNTSVICGVAESVPLPNNSVDLIMSNNGLNNVNNLEQALAECYRISKPNAQLAFTYNLEETMLEFYSVFKTVLRDLNLNELVNRVDTHIHSKRKPLTDMLTLIDCNGFDVISQCKESFQYWYVDATAFFHYFFIRLSFLPSWKSICAEENEKIIFKLIETKLNKIVMTKGKFELTIPFAVIDCRKKL